MTMQSYYERMFQEDKKERVRNKERFKIALQTNWESEVSYKELIEMLSFSAFKEIQWNKLSITQQRKVLSQLEREYYHDYDKLNNSRKIEVFKTRERNGKYCPSQTLPFENDSEIDEGLLKLLELDSQEDDIKEKVKNGFNILSIYFKEFLRDIHTISINGEVNMTFKLMESLIPVLAKNHKLNPTEVMRSDKADWRDLRRFNKKVIQSYSSNDAYKELPWLATFKLGEGFSERITTSIHYEEATLLIPISHLGLNMIKCVIDDNPEEYEEYRQFYELDKVLT